MSLWAFQVNTDNNINSKRPDIIGSVSLLNGISNFVRPDIIMNCFNDKTCILVDMSVPADQKHLNLNFSKFQKMQKWKLANCDN